MTERNITQLKLAGFSAICGVCIIFILYNAVYLGLQTVYPKEYTALVEENCEKNDVSEPLMYALIEAESGYDKNAVSSAGAMGLTQITPETFQWLQTKTGESLSDDKLFDPEISVRYGTLFLGMLLEEFGDTGTSLAAYHAGRGRVQEWLRNPEYSSDGYSLDKIPFEDTDAYVKKVLKNVDVYKIIYGME